MKFDHKLFETFPIVSPDKFEMGMHGMRVPGGYVFWWCPSGGAYLQQFVPMEAIESDPICGARAARQARLNASIDRLGDEIFDEPGAPSDTE